MKTRKYYLIKLQDDLYRFTFRMDIESIIMETIIIEPYYPYYEIIGIVESDYTTMKPIYEALNNYKKETFYGECEEVINFFLNNRTKETIELIQTIRTASIPEGNLTTEATLVLIGISLNMNYLYNELHRFLYTTFTKLLESGKDRRFLYKLFDYEQDYKYKEGESANIELIRNSHRDPDNQLVQNLRNALERAFAFKLYNNETDKRKVDKFINNRYTYNEQYNIYIPKQK